MTERSRSRRNFLNPKSLGQLASTVSGGEWTAAAPESAPADGWICRVRREAMATRFEFLFEALDADRLSDFEMALDLIDDLESQLSVYRDTSEVCDINRRAFHEAVQVEPRLFDLLLLSQHLWQNTDRCFDIAVHALLVAWGMFKGPVRELGSTEIEAARSKSGMDAITLEGADRTVRFSREGIGFNLGAIGKGYALDRACEALVRKGVEHFLIHGGHSSVLGKGSSTWESGWLVEVTSPWNWSEPLARVRIENRAMSTSALRQETLLGGQDPHVLDPRTGRPVETDLASVTVLAPSAATAEGLSTAFLVMGLDKTLEYCEKQSDVGVLLVRRSASPVPIDLVQSGIPVHALEVLL